MNTNQTKEILRKFPNDKSVMLIAKHGVGKSSVVKQVAQEGGISFHDVRLSQCEVGDIKGLPYLDRENMQTTFLKPKWWPRDPASKGILFFDELNRANKDVLQAVFEICLDRRLDGEALPDGWRVVAAINGDEDYDVVELDPALFDRWFIIDFAPSAKEWLAWATSYGVHEAIRDFVSRSPELLDPPVENMQAGRVYPSRRSWVAFNDTANAMGLLEKADDGMLTQVCKGWLGQEIAAIFSKFLQNEFSRLKASDIIFDWERVKDKVEASASDVEVIASIANSVVSALKKLEPEKVNEAAQDNLMFFVMCLPMDVASSIWTDLLKITYVKKFMTARWKPRADFTAFMDRVYCT